MHRVYVHDGEVWTLASTYAKREGYTLCPDDEYVVIETAQSASYQEVCMLTDDGKRLCDIGSEHDHGN
jgi:hypothetical protein